MAIDKILQIYDEQGNLVDYDILASDVKFLPDGKDLPTKLAELEDEIGEGGYTPPQGGIPKTDLAPSVQTSLDLADTAYQKPASGIPASDIADGVIPNVSGLATKTEVDTGLASKVDKNGTDSLMTAAEHTKLDGIAAGAQVNTINSISVNGTPATPVNGNVNISVEEGSQIDPATSAPVMDGTAAVGASTKYAREDHVHPHDTSKQDALTFDNVPTANSNNPVKSGGIKTAIENILSNITIGQNGHWYVGSTDTGIQAQGPKGNSVADGETFDIVNNLTDGGESDALSAEMGKRLVTRMGSFGEAWVWSNTFPYPFTWILNDTINGANIKKPIYHIGNGVFIDSVGAVVMLVAAAPSIPEFSIADNSQVNKNAPLSISFDAGSILHYKVNSGDTQIATASPAVINLTTACTIEAWAENAAGTSSHRSRSYTIAAPADPTFDTASGELVYGTSINISFGAGLTLYYRINSGSWATTQQSPLTLAIEGATNIDAYASDGDNVSNTISRAYTIAAPSAPTFDTDSSELDYGTQISIAWTSGVLKYTINSGTAQTASTSPLAIAITEGMTIEAWAEQGGLQSTHVTKTYTLAPQAMKITASEATSVDITPTGGSATTYQLSAGENRLNLSTIDPNDDGIASIAFADNTKITAFDGGGATFTGTDLSFFSGASNLVSFSNLVTTSSLNHLSFYSCGKLEVLDTSHFASCTLTGMENSFRSCGRLEEIDLSMCALTAGGTMRSAFYNASRLKTLKIGKWDTTNSTSTATLFYGVTGITTLVCSSSTAPYCPASGGWLDPATNNSLPNKNTAFQSGGAGVIKVPASAVNDYKAADGWSALANFIVADDE